VSSSAQTEPEHADGATEPESKTAPPGAPGHAEDHAAAGAPPDREPPGTTNDGQTAQARTAQANAGLEEQAPDVPSTSKASGANTEGDPSAPDTSGRGAANRLAARGSSNPSDPARDGAGSSAERQPPLTERDQEIEQRLNRIPDDPGGLLREKLRRRYAQKRYSMNERR